MEVIAMTRLCAGLFDCRLQFRAVHAAAHNYCHLPFQPAVGLVHRTSEQRQRQYFVLTSLLARLIAIMRMVSGAARHG